MQIYHYHPDTGLYQGTSEARVDALETAKGRAAAEEAGETWENVYLLPAHATSLAPPKAVQGKAQVFDGLAWSVVVDLRDTSYWLDGNEQTMQALGPLPKGALTEAPPPTPEQKLAVEAGWVQMQLNRSDIELNKVLDGHTRTSGTEAAWRQHRNSLRDYIKAGVLKGSRPVAPDA